MEDEILKDARLLLDKLNNLPMNTDVNSLIQEYQSICGRWNNFHNLTDGCADLRNVPKGILRSSLDSNLNRILGNT